LANPHLHLVLDLEEGEIDGLALPADGTAPGPGGGVERTAVLTGAIDGVNRVFAFPVAVEYDPPIGVQPKVYHGGRRYTPDQIEIYESSPGVSGYDRVRLLYRAPRRNDIMADFVEATP